MPRFLPEPAYRHGTAERTAVLLINLGTPDEPTAPALRRYLKEFLSDPRVVEIPKALWWLILNGVILNLRPKKSAEKYASIWSRDGSPLRIHSERLARLVRGSLGAAGVDVDVVCAMRYGQPSVARVIEDLRARNVRRVLVVPLYPQYAASTSATAFDSVFAHLLRCRNQPEIRGIRSFPDHPGYIAALAASIRDHWRQNGRPDDSYRLLLSFHGVPRYTLTRGDPYHCECQKTARLLREELGLPPEQMIVAFQSRFGKAEWLQPYTAPTLEKLAREGVRRVDVICPGFVADCLETLEEIAMEGKASFLAAGGREFHYVPCLNDRADWVAALGELISSHLQGWPTQHAPELLAASAQRAHALGAQN